MPPVLEQGRAANLGPVFGGELTLEGQKTGPEGVLGSKPFLFRLSIRPENRGDEIARHVVHACLDPKGLLSALEYPDHARECIGGGQAPL